MYIYTSGWLPLARVEIVMRYLHNLLYVVLDLLLVAAADLLLLLFSGGGV